MLYFVAGSLHLIFDDLDPFIVYPSGLSQCVADANSLHRHPCLVVLAHRGKDLLLPNGILICSHRQLGFLPFRSFILRARLGLVPICVHSTCALVVVCFWLTFSFLLMHPTCIASCCCWSPELSVLLRCLCLGRFRSLLSHNARALFSAGLMHRP